MKGKIGKFKVPAIAMLLVMGMMLAAMPVKATVVNDETELATVLLIYGDTVYYIDAMKNADGDYVPTNVVSIERDKLVEQLSDGAYIIDPTKIIPPFIDPPKYLPVYVEGYMWEGDVLADISVPPLGCGVKVVQTKIWIEAGLQNMWTGEKTELVGTLLSGATIRPYHDGTIPILDFLNLAINVAG